MDTFNQLMALILNPWTLFGFTAQFIFFARFIVQWYVSERAGKVIMPKSFWYLSITGAIMILIYAIHRQDIVFITGQFLALMIYVRNIIIAQNEDKGQNVLIKPNI